VSGLVLGVSSCVGVDGSASLHEGAALSAFSDNWACPIGITGPVAKDLCLC
jgi:hypothetical protein